MKKKVIITGGSGFLGTALSKALLTKGYEVVSLDLAPPRVEGVHFVKANMLETLPKDQLLKKPFAVINLSGKSIFGRWTPEHTKLVRDTRVVGTRHLIELFADPEYRPEVLISASAVGFYGDRGSEQLDESSFGGNDFLAQVAQAWEAEARKAEKHDVRVQIIRNGHIMGAAGMLGVLLPYYKWGIGGPLGSGTQWMPWIHIDDCVALYVRAMEDASLPTVVNAVAPEEITNKQFSEVLAHVLHRPHLFWIPVFALRFLYGDFAEAMVSSQKVTSMASEDTFGFPTIRATLENLVS